MDVWNFMFAKRLSYLLLGLWCLKIFFFSANVNAEHKKARTSDNISLDNTFYSKLDNFVDNNFNRHSITKDFKLTKPELNQIFWLKNGSYSTTEHAVIASNKEISVELIRVLTRLYCLHLLRINTQQSYRDFVKSQTSSLPDTRILKYVSFKKIANYISKLPEIEYQAFRIATITYSLTKTDFAYNRAKIYLPNAKIPEDSSDFLNFTIKKAPVIYPLYHNFIVSHPNTRALFNAAFSSDMHLRHMLHVEGGIGMFKNLREKLQYRKLNPEKINFWFYFWLINIAGFYGHIDHNGSLMLDNDNFQALMNLKYHLDQMMFKPNYNPLKHYLYYRAKKLNLDSRNLNPKLILVMSHIGSNLRLFTSAKGIELLYAFNSINKIERQTISDEIYILLNNYDEKTPSYLPAFLMNCYLYSGKDLDQTVKTAVPIYAKALKEFRLSKAIKHNNSRLSFYNLSSKTSIKKIFDSYSEGKNVNLFISDSGFVNLSN